MNTMSSEQIIIPVVAIVSTFMCGAVGIFAGVWYKLRVKQWEMSLKHSMLERGMSVDEIKAVLGASVEGRGCHELWTKSASSCKEA